MEVVVGEEGGGGGGDLKLRGESQRQEQRLHLNDK